MKSSTGSLPSAASWASRAYAPSWYLHSMSSVKSAGYVRVEGVINKRLGTSQWHEYSESAGCGKVGKGKGGRVNIRNRKKLKESDVIIGWVHWD